MIQSIKRTLAKSKISKRIKDSSREFVLPVRTAAIILDSTNINALPELLKLKQIFNLGESCFKVVLFRNKKDDFPEFDGLTFAEEDLNFLGNFRNKELLGFTKNNIDLLITFTEENNIPINLLTASCNAGLKVGNNTNNQKILDIIIRSGAEVEVFTSEVIKFLKQYKSTLNE
jgi:hypothetical protein